ncbi:hypothetical protein D3C77_735650 [compost metagenome]
MYLEYYRGFKDKSMGRGSYGLRSITAPPQQANVEVTAYKDTVRPFSYLSSYAMTLGPPLKIRGDGSRCQ